MTPATVTHPPKPSLPSLLQSEESVPKLTTSFSPVTIPEKAGSKSSPYSQPMCNAKQTGTPFYQLLQQMPHTQKLGLPINPLAHTSVPRKKAKLWPYPIGIPRNLHIPIGFMILSMRDFLNSTLLEILFLKETLN